MEAELIASRPDSAAHQGARLELAQIEAAQSRLGALLQMAWLAPRAELALPQELAEDFLTTGLAAAPTPSTYLYVFFQIRFQTSGVCQTSDPV